MSVHLSEQEIIRRQKLQDLKKSGIDPYPAPLYPVNTTSTFIKQNFKGEENKNDFADVCLAGRIMGIRDMGKASFAVLQDAEGKIQLYVKKDDICPGDDKTLYDVVPKENLLESISSVVLQTQSKISTGVLEKYINKQSRENYIKTAIVELMSTPEYQLC